MPIQGVTTNIAPAFPELGLLRKGGEASRDATGKVLRMGADLKHLRFTSERPEVVKAFQDCYGAEPSLLTVYLPYLSIDDNWSAWQEAWSASTLLHRCDGVTCVRWYGPDGKYHDEPKACPGGCKQVGRLRVILPELLTVGYIGFVTVLTSSLHDIMSLQGGLMAAQAASPTGLRGVPFVLWRQPERISTPAGNGKRARREKSLLKIAPSGQWVQAMLAGAEHQAFAMLEGPKGARLDVDTTTGEVPLTAEDVEDAEFVAADECTQAEQDTPPADEVVGLEAPELEPEPVELAHVDLGTERQRLLDSITALAPQKGRTMQQIQTWAGQNYSKEWEDLTVAELETVEAKLRKLVDVAATTKSS